MHNRHYSYHHIVNTSIALEHFRAMKGGRHKYPRSKNAYLFTTLVKGNPLTSGDLRKTLRTVAQRQLGSRRVYPHLMRHAQEHFLLPVVPGEHKAA